MSWTPQIVLLRAVCQRLVRLGFDPRAAGFYLVCADWTAHPLRSGGLARVEARPVLAQLGPLPEGIVPFLTYRPDREGD